MILLQNVMLLNQSHLVNQDVVTLLLASKKLRLATMLSRTMSSSPQLLPLGRSKFYRSDDDRALELCLFCKKPGYVMSNCLKRRARQEQKDAAVQLVSTLPSPVTQDQVNDAVVQKPQEVDPRFEGNCSLVTLIRPDKISVRDCL